MRTDRIRAVGKKVLGVTAAGIVAGATVVGGAALIGDGTAGSAVNAVTSIVDDDSVGAQGQAVVDADNRSASPAHTLVQELSADEQEDIQYSRYGC